MLKYICIVSSIVFGMLVAIAFAQSPKVKQDIKPPALLDRQVPGDEAETLTTVGAFSLALNYTGAPGGMIRTSSCEQQPANQVWRPMGSPLRDVLDSIVLADPQYFWRTDDGVINLLPKTGEPQLLHVLISEFSIDDATSAMASLSQLLARPEITTAMTDLKLDWGLQVGTFPSSPNPKKFSVHCKDVTLRQALNAIARMEGRAVWYYVETRCNGNHEVVIKF